MYEGVSHEGILNRMSARVSDKLDKREGSVIWDAHSPAALEITALYIELERVLNEGFGDTASREFLVRRCAERGITPFPASKAVCKGEFSPPNIDVLGKRFNIGEINFIVTEKITDGTYRAECEEAGSIGNRYLGQLSPIDYINGLEKAELTELLIPGEDEEDVEELRKRYFDSFDISAFGGNVKDYTLKATAIPGVGQTKVTRVWNSDIRPSEMIPPEKVKRWYEETRDSLSEEVKNWLDTVFRAASEKKLTVGGTVLLTILGSDLKPASAELTAKVQETIDPEPYGGEGLGLAPIGHLVTVRSAEEFTVDVDFQVSLETDYTLSSLKGKIRETIEEYFKELKKAWGGSSTTVVRISQIESRLLAVEGIVDVEKTKLNGKEENLRIEALKIPVLGGVEGWVK